MVKRKQDKYKIYQNELINELIKIEIPKEEAPKIASYYVGLFNESKEISTIVESAVKSFLKSPDGIGHSIKITEKGDYIERESVLEWGKSHDFISPVKRKRKRKCAV